MTEFRPFSDVFLDTIHHASSSPKPISALLIKNAHIPFILFDSTVSASFPIVLSSTASTKLYGYTTIPKTKGDPLAMLANFIKSFFLRLAEGEVRVVEAGFNKDTFRKNKYDGKIKLVYLSSSMFGASPKIVEILDAQSHEIHRLSRDKEYELLFLNISRILYNCR